MASEQGFWAIGGVRALQPAHLFGMRRAVPMGRDVENAAGLATGARARCPTACTRPKPPTMKSVQVSEPASRVGDRIGGLQRPLSF